MNTFGPRKLLIFTSSWCTACLQLNIRLGKMFNPLVLSAVVYDIEKDNDIFKTWGVYTIPVLIMLSGDGREVSRIIAPSEVGLARFLQ